MSIPDPRRRRALVRVLPALIFLVTAGHAPAPGDVLNTVLADVSTEAGSVGPGSAASTHASDDVYEVLTEMQTYGKPKTRLSLLDHVWAFDVAPGNNYSFEVEAHRNANSDGDDFRFSYSTDDVSWTPMVTVAEASDSFHAHTFAVDVAGPLYVRVEDTDHTPGHRSQDVLSVDQMLIVSDRTHPDTTPPASLDSLAADPADQLVSLTWSPSDVGDLGGYLVERATGGGAFELLTRTPIASSSYEDSDVSNLTSYRYRVRVVDQSGNESAPSPEISAVPHAGGGPVLLHVASIFASTQTVVAGWKAGRANVAVADEFGQPVAGVLVRVTFGGSYFETLSATTDASGRAVIQTNQAEKGKVSISACVDELSHPTMFYSSQDNLQACTK